MATKHGKNTKMSDGVRAGIRAYQMKQSNDALQGYRRLR